MTTPTIRHCADLVAALLYDAGIRLADEDDLLALDKASALQQSTIARLYREAMGADWEVVVTSADLDEHLLPAAALMAAAWRTARDALTDEVDAALWSMQCAERRERVA